MMVVNSHNNVTNSHVKNLREQITEMDQFLSTVKKDNANLLTVKNDEMKV